MLDHLNAMQAEARKALSSRSSARIGLVSSFDPTHYAIKALIQPENTETGWIPVGAIWVGAGWGLACPPSVGDQVVLIPIEGQAEAWVMGPRLFNDIDRPPNAVSGQFVLIHESGSMLEFNNDGTVKLISIGTLTTSAPQWNHTGNIAVTGTITATQDVTAGQGGADQVGLQTHKHPTAATGGPSSPTPGT